jgi:hypothetical protein
MLGIVRQVIKVILWGLILQPGLALSEFLITEAQDKSYFTVEADSVEEAVEASKTFCKNQEFKFDKTKYRVIIKETLFNDPVIKAWCFYEPKELTQIQLKQLQYRKTSVPPAKMSEAVAAWAELKYPVMSYQVKKSNFILPQGTMGSKDELTKQSYWSDFIISPYKLFTIVPLNFAGGGVINVNIDITPSPPKLNNEGFWLALPSVKNGYEGETIIRMKLTTGDGLIDKPEIYNRFFREIASSNFIESIEFEPMPIE